MNGPILRLLDANANRAREGLRTLEDYARFILNDPDLSAALKDIRHELTVVLKPILLDAILFRDTPGDVGTVIKTEHELQRTDLSEIVTAAGKRLGEALRAIEEYLKTINLADSSRVERVRYRFYDVEQRLSRTLVVTNRFPGVRLYVLITESCCRLPWLEAAEQCLLGGADCLQLREKDLASAELLRRARQVSRLCHQHGKLCIINDRPDIAILSDADGVHVGQEDLPATEVRKLIGREKILGVSTHRIEQARQAVLDGADYIGVGPIFPSRTKPRDFVAGIEYARQVAGEIHIPTVAIAGIGLENVDEVAKTGIGVIAVTAAVLGSDNPQAATAQLKQKFIAGGQTFLSAYGPKDQNLVGQTFLSASKQGSQPLVGQAFLPANGSLLEKTRRRLPHWKLDGSTYFVTFRLAGGELSEAERILILDHVKSGNGKFYLLIAAVVMPDHVHLLIQPTDDYDLSRICKGIKGVAARLLNQHRGTRGKVWQEESWDRIMRNQSELDEKLEYMLNNPVKKELVVDGWLYGGWYYNETWEERSR